MQAKGEENDDVDTDQLLKEKAPQEEADIPFCGCLSVRYYKPYFDVDTADISSRIMSSLFYCRSEQNFLASISARPDAYGPFWISTTLVFTLAVASHLNGFLSSYFSGALWEYDFSDVMSASSLIYSYTLLAPLGLWFLFRQYEQGLKFVTVLCLYGYSLTVLLPAVLLCMIPSELICWVSLLLASLSSSIFLLRSLGPLVITQARKQAAVLLGSVGLIQLSLVLLLKFYFFYSS